MSNSAPDVYTPKDISNIAKPQPTASSGKDFMKEATSFIKELNGLVTGVLQAKQVFGTLSGKEKDGAADSTAHKIEKGIENATATAKQAPQRTPKMAVHLENATTQIKMMVNMALESQPETNTIGQLKEFAEKELTDDKIKEFVSAFVKQHVTMYYE